MIVPLREGEQPDVFGPLLLPHSHLHWQKLSLPIFGSFKRNCLELLCFCHMGKSLQHILTEKECGLREDECVCVEVNGRMKFIKGFSVN